MIGNPNELGFLLLLLSVTALLNIAIYGRTWRLISLLLLMLLSLIMTLSRSAIFLMAFVATIYIILYFSSSFKWRGGTLSLHRKRLFWVGFIISIAALSLSLVSEIAFLATNLLGALHYENFDSFYARFSSWEENLYHWHQSPVFGIGTLSRSGLFGASDNEHLYLLRVGGVILWVLVMLLIWNKAFIRCRHRFLNATRIVVPMMATVFMIPAGVFFSTVLFSYFILLVTLIATLSHYFPIKTPY
jgi:hypothetical protein